MPPFSFDPNLKTITIENTILEQSVIIKIKGEIKELAVSNELLVTIIVKANLGAPYF